MRWMVPAAVIGVLLLSGCAGERATTGATPSASSSVTATASPLPTTTVVPTGTATAAPPATTEPTTDPSTGPVVSPIDTIVDACTAWQDSLSQDAATYPVTQSKAAQLAAAAAAVDSKWQTLAADMATLVSLAGDTSDSAIAQGQTLFTDLSTQCGTAGVTVNAG